MNWQSLSLELKVMYKSEDMTMLYAFFVSLLLQQYVQESKCFKCGQSSLVYRPVDAFDASFTWSHAHLRGCRKLSGESSTWKNSHYLEPVVYCEQYIHPDQILWNCSCLSLAVRTHLSTSMMPSTSRFQPCSVGHWDHFQALGRGFFSAFKSCGATLFLYELREEGVAWKETVKGG